MNRDLMVGLSVAALLACIAGPAAFALDNDAALAKAAFERLKTEPRRDYEGYYSPAFRELVEIGAAAVPYCVQGFLSNDRYVARWCGYALSRIGYPSLPVLRGLVAQGTVEARTQAILRIAQMHLDGNPDHLREVREVLASLLKDNEPEIRRWAISGLGYFRNDDRFTANETIVRTIMASLRDPSPVVRTQACSSLSTPSDSIAGPYLIAALQDNDEGVRAGAAHALGIRKDEGAIQALAAMRDDPSLKVRQETAGALCRLCDLRSVRCLVAFLDQKDAHGNPTGGSAAAAIMQLLGRETIGDYPSCIPGARLWWKTTGERRYGKLQIPQIPAGHANPYFGNALRKVLPEEWEVLWGEQCQAPAGWARAGTGDPGNVIHIWQPGALSTPVNCDDEVPYVRLWFMPITWEGDSATLLQRIRDKRITREAVNVTPAGATETAAYYGSSQTLLLFYRSNRLSDWRQILRIAAEAFDIAGAP